MRRTRHALAVMIGLAPWLGGCGILVPEIQEPSNTPAQGQLLVQAIVHRIHCEIKDAIIDVLGKKGAPGYAESAFMDNWGAQVALTLTVDEKTAFNPNTSWLVPSPMTAIFTLGVGATLSSDATRTEKLNTFYDVNSIRSGSKCPANPPNDSPKTTSVPPPQGSLLVQSDLKLREWLNDEVMAVGTLEMGSPTDPASILKQNVISHEVKFEVVTSGNITPAWKLVRATVNQSGSLFSTSRDRTHDLLITFGPIDINQKNGGLIPVAENAHLSSQLGLAVSNAFRGGASQ